jgi:glutathione S-transferase
MTEPVLYGHPWSIYTRSARLALEEKDAVYRLDVLGPGAMKSAEHLARHPFGKIPFLEHDGLWLYETLAILDYVEAAFDGPRLRPAGAREVGRMSQALQVVHNYAVPAWGGGIVRHRIIGPKVRGIAPDEAAIAAGLPQAVACAKVIEDLLGPTPYLAGEAISLADLMLAPIYDSVSRTPEARAVLTPFPGLAAWWARMAERPSVQATAPDFDQAP